MKYFKYVSLLAISFFIMSCESDDDNISQDPQPTGDYADGFFVVNEGPFGGTGSLTFVKNDFSEVVQNAFTIENPNADIGSFIQSVFVDEERMFIVANGSNLINVVNRFSLESIAVIDAGFEVPRYGVVIDNKAYVTNLASFSSTTDDFISVINLDTYEVENTIPVNNIANQIESYNGKLIVQNSAFADGNSVSLINPETNQVEAVAEVGDGLNAMVLANNKLFTLSNSQFSEIDLSNFSDQESLILPAEAQGATNLRLDANQLYYSVGNSVYSNTLEQISFTEEALFEYVIDSFYGFHVKNEQVYMADAGDFASNGNIYVLDISGNLLFETEVDLSPNGFFFN